MDTCFTQQPSDVKTQTRSILSAEAIGGQPPVHLWPRASPPCRTPAAPHSPLAPPVRTGDCGPENSAAAEYARAGAPRSWSRAPRPGLAKPEVAWGARRPRSRGLCAADTRGVRGAGGGRWGRTGMEEAGGARPGSRRRRAESARGRGPGSPAASSSPGMGPGGRRGRRAALPGVDSPLPPLVQLPPPAVFRQTGIPKD